MRVAFITQVRNSSDNGDAAEAEPSPSRKALSRIQCTRSKLGFIPKSEPRHCRRSTVSGSPLGMIGETVGRHAGDHAETMFDFGFRHRVQYGIGQLAHELRDFRGGRQLLHNGRHTLLVLRITLVELGGLAHHAREGVLIDLGGAGGHVRECRRW